MEAGDIPGPPEVLEGSETGYVADFTASGVPGPPEPDLAASLADVADEGTAPPPPEVDD